MPGPAARALTIEHQLRLAALTDDLSKRVRAIARNADGDDIDRWWGRVVADIVALVAAFFRTILGLTEQYLREHAAAEGRDVDPQPTRWITEQVMTSLRVTGPVAFKRSIRAGRDVGEAVSAMADTLAASAARLAQEASRRTIEETADAAGAIVGWRRVSDGNPCAFCAMLISRGAVYLSGETAGDERFGGEPYHDNDGCSAEPLYVGEREPEEVQWLQRQWRSHAQGKPDALRAWRSWWDETGREEFGREELSQLGEPDEDATRVPVLTPAPQARAELDMHGARALAEMAIEIEEAAGNQASARAIIHRVRARMRRTRLEPVDDERGLRYVWQRPGGDIAIDPDDRALIDGVDPQDLAAARALVGLAIDVETLVRDNADYGEIIDRVRSRAAEHDLRPLGRASEVVTFDRSEHTPRGDVADGAPAVVIRPGYRWGDNVLIERALVREASESDLSGREPEPTVDPAEQRARERQARIDAARARAELLAEIEEVAIINEATGDVRRRQINQAARRLGMDGEATMESVMSVADSRSAEELGEAIETAAKLHGFTRIGGPSGQSLQVIAFDRARHGMISGERPPPAGTFVEVVRPGYLAEIDGEQVLLFRATVSETDELPGSSRTPQADPDTTPEVPSPRQELPVAVWFSAMGQPLGVDGQPIVGHHREVTTAILDEAAALDAMRTSGFSTVRRAALARLDVIDTWLFQRPDAQRRVSQIRDEIEGASPERIVAMLRDLAGLVAGPPRPQQETPRWRPTFAELAEELGFGGDMDRFVAHFGLDPDEVTPDEEMHPELANDLREFAGRDRVEAPLDPGDADDDGQDGERPELGSLIPRDRAEAQTRRRELTRAFQRHLNGTYAGLEVRLTRVEPETDRIEVTADIFDSQGAKVGNTTRYFIRSPRTGTLYAQHALLKIDGAVQGQGFAEAWNKHLMGWYQESSFSHIAVTANIDVGGYTWARQGFDFDDRHGPIGIAARLEAEINLGGYTDSQLSAAREMVRRLRDGIFGQNGYPTAYEVSQIGRLSGQGKGDRWPGKQAMLGSTWSGIKPVPPRLT